MSAPRKKCNSRGWCSTLEERAKPSGMPQAGIQFVRTDKILANGTIETRVYGVAHRHTAKDKGLFLNFCPWCGGSLRFLIKKPRLYQTL